MTERTHEAIEFFSWGVTAVAVAIFIVSLVAR